MRRTAALLLALALVLCAGPATASANGAEDLAAALNLPWPQALPPLPASAAVQPHAVEGCRQASLACIDYEIARMSTLQDRFGCDHRGVFDTTYLELTKTLRRTIATEPRFFVDSRYLEYEDALFAAYYFHVVRDYAARRPVDPAWRIAFDTARTGDANAGQDMLLGINAHVQNDMPFVIAQLGVRRPNGDSRKPDHDHFNTVLQRAYEAVVGQIAARFDPIISVTNAGWDPADNVGGLELVKFWREGVWRNAERLLNATTQQERDQVAAQIHSNAAMWAQMIAAPQVPPGYRAQRDAYCARQAAARRRAAQETRRSTAARRTHRHRRHHAQRRRR